MKIHRWSDKIPLHFIKAAGKDASLRILKVLAERRIIPDYQFVFHQEYSTTSKCRSSGDPSAKCWIPESIARPYFSAPSSHSEGLAWRHQLRIIEQPPEVDVLPIKSYLEGTFLCASSMARGHSHKPTAINRSCTDDSAALAVADDSNTGVPHRALTKPPDKVGERMKTWSCFPSSNWSCSSCGHANSVLATSKRQRNSISSQCQIFYLDKKTALKPRL